MAAAFCKMDLALFFPNLSKSVAFLSNSFLYFSNAGRKSDNRVYKNLEIAKLSLEQINTYYILNEDVFDLADFSTRVAQSSFCSADH
jgi:hypothetical protein